MLDYYDTLKVIHTMTAPRRYVEIGVRHGDSLALAPAGCTVVAIDPAPELRLPLTHLGALTLRTQTSDEYFASSELIEADFEESFDLAFVDGAHTWQSALSDFAHLESLAKPGSVILLHDGLPIDEATSTPERHTKLWSGDVWKAVVALKRFRPELSITTLDVYPTGLTVVRNLRPADRTLFDNWEEIESAVACMTFNDLASKSEALNARNGTLSSIAAALGRQPSSVSHLARVGYRAKHAASCTIRPLRLFRARGDIPAEP